MHIRQAKTVLLFGCVALFALVIAGCGGARTRHHRGGPAGPQSIPTIAASPATVQPKVSIAGIIAPYQNVSISSSLSEPTDRVNVIQGDRVYKGEVLAVLDTADLVANYNADLRNAESADAKAVQTKYQAQLNLGQGNYQVSSALAAMRNAKLVYQQNEQLYKSGYVSQSSLEAARATYVQDQQTYNTAVLNAQVNGNTAQGLQAATVASAIADAQSAHAQADQIEAQIVRATIVSPVDGIVVNRNLNPGEYPGSRTIFTIQQLNPVYAELNASSQNVFSIPRGAPVSLSVSGVANATYTGHVSAVLGQVSPGSTNFTVECIADNPGDRLQSGMAVTGTISLPSVSGVGIPTAAFLDDSHTSIMIVDQNGQAKEQKVTEIGSNGTTSIVTGIANGTKLVANGQLGITSGEQVASVDASPSPGASASPGHHWHTP
ncbi:MAG TPA: efflux RND transporter periplasmic adaptor subunit [Candidatus Acidoferrales bacterium]|nr:efflux RND transporter periplasmic adaptor subunit [Candidatus Acidoferrales bacterium]